MEEVIGISDRVVVMRKGEVSGELAARDLSEEAILTPCRGLKSRSSPGSSSGLVIRARHSGAIAGREQRR